MSRDGLMEEDKHKIARRKKNKSPEPGDVDDEAVTRVPIAIDLTIPSSPIFVCSQCSAEVIRHGSLLRHIESGRHKIRPEKITQFDFALGMYKRLLEEAQQGIGITPLADWYKQFQQAPAHPKPMGWALRTTKKGAKYNAKAKKLVVDLFEKYYKQSQKLRAEEAEKKMKDTVEIQPAERMTHDQIKNCIRGLLAAKKKELEKTRGGNRRRRALVEDMITELDDEGGAIEEEVEVDEEDREITADDIYDMIHMNMAEYFDDPTNIIHSTPDVGNFDE